MSIESIKEKIGPFLDSPPNLLRGSLFHQVEEVLSWREPLLKIGSEYPTPCYVFDPASFEAALRRYRTAFEVRLPRFKPFYAMKSNHHETVVKAVVDEGYGVDVSSTRELSLALGWGAVEIIFTGPGKGRSDLEAAWAARDRVILNIDSFGELRALRDLHPTGAGVLRAGVRIHLGEQSGWTKFGIPIDALQEFFTEAADIPYLSLEGIQFHHSWNKDAAQYVKTIERLGSYFQTTLEPRFRTQLTFIDFGGGMRPVGMEALYAEQIPYNSVISTVADHFQIKVEFPERYYLKEALPLEEYASEIAGAIERCLAPQVDCTYFGEPGRIVSTYAMHFLVRVMDVKGGGIVITDGGTHMVGWDRYELFYTPIVNLTHPSREEIPVKVCGSLCDPADYFGFSCYAERMEPGDLLVIPFQGAYSVSLAQNFIKPIPEVRMLPRS